MHSLTFDQTTREGSAIVALFNRIEAAVAKAGGGPWNPGATTDTLLDWFGAQGIDVDGGPITSRTPSGLAAAQPAHTPEECTGMSGPGITLTRAQLDAWAGFALTDEDIERIEEALPLSSLPDVVGTIAFAVRPDAVGEGDEDEEAQQ